MRYYPAFHDIAGRPCLVVGGGEAAAQKIRLLRKAGPRVTVVAPWAGAEIEALAAEGRVRLVRRAFVDADVTGCALVHAATGLARVDGAVAAAAGAVGIPVNAVDRPELSSFTVPAIVDRDPVVIGISTGGSAPVLARRLRGRIEALLPARLGRLARFAGRFRAAVGLAIPEAVARRRFWERFFDGPVAARVLAGDEAAARSAMLALVNRPAGPSRGRVSLVGAGPGDVDLLTLRALRCLMEADVVIHDSAAGPGILDYARRDALRIDVGKTPGAIADLLAFHTRAGGRVVRLMAGDPFVFGRGGGEYDELRRRGVEVEVVPGIAAAPARPAAMGGRRA